jgi:hypothetical protein
MNPKRFRNANARGSLYVVPGMWVREVNRTKQYPGKPNTLNANAWGVRSD